MKERTLERLKAECVAMNYRLARSLENYRVVLNDAFCGEWRSDVHDDNIMGFMITARGAIGNLVVLLYCGGRPSADEFLPDVRELIGLRLEEAYALDLRGLSTHHTVLTASFFHHLNALNMVLKGRIDECALRRASDTFKYVHEKEDAPMNWRIMEKLDIINPSEAAQECVGRLLLGEGDFVLDYMNDFPLERINSLKPDDEPDTECLIVAYFTALEQTGKLGEGDKMGQKAHAMTLAWEWLRQWSTSVPPVAPIDMFMLWTAMWVTEGKALDPDAILEDLQPQRRLDALAQVGKNPPS